MYYIRKVPLIESSLASTTMYENFKKEHIVQTCRKAQIISVFYSHDIYSRSNFIIHQKGKDVQLSRPSGASESDKNSLAFIKSVLP